MFYSSLRPLAGSFLFLALAVAMATVCSGQEMQPNQQQLPGMAAVVPAMPANPLPGLPPPNLPPPNPYPAFPVPLNVQPGPAAAPANGPPQAADATPELPPYAFGSGPAADEKVNEAVLPDDTMGFGLGGRMDGVGGGGGMHPVDSVRYSTLWLPNVPVHGQDADFEMLRQDLGFTHPLWKDPLNALSLTGGVRNELIQTDAILPGVGQPVPSELWGVNLGLRYSRQLDDGWITGGGVSIGSASDHPFAGWRELNIGMNAMLRIPQGEHNAWIFTLAYSPLGELAFPVPGVAFSYNPSPQFHANIGLPLMVMWRPTDDWQFQASYMLLRTVHVKSQYRFARWLSGFAAYDWSNESYFLVDSPDSTDRFFIYDQRASLGLQTAFMQHFTASVSTGFIFDRYLFEGTSSTSTSADRVYLGNGPFAGMNLGARW
jgi:hypothetical protein